MPETEVRPSAECSPALTGSFAESMKLLDRESSPIERADDGAAAFRAQIESKITSAC